MKKRHLIMISVDAMVLEDLEYARSLPNFSTLFNRGSMIRRVRSTYPSLTHTAHATIMSGASPKRTGIVSNTVFNPADPQHGSSVWYNDLDEVGCETLFEAAKRAGLTTAACAHRRACAWNRAGRCRRTRGGGAFATDAYRGGINAGKRNLLWKKSSPTKI